MKAYCLLIFSHKINTQNQELNKREANKCEKIS